HDWPGTTLHITLLTLSITTGLFFYGVACDALHRDGSDADAARARNLTLAMLFAIAAGFVSLGIFYEPPGVFDDRPKAPAFFGGVVVSSVVFALCWPVGRILARLGFWPI